MSNTNKQIQHETTPSLMQHANIEDNYLLWAYQAIPLKNISTSSPENTRSRKWTQCPQVQNANQLTEQPVKSSFIPAARSGGSPASSPAKIWNIHINPVKHTYYYFSKTNPINYDTYQETEPNYNNSIIIIQRLHLRKSSLHQYTNITQSSNTFQHLNIQPSQWCYNFENVSSVRKCWTFSLTHIIISEDSLCAHAEANIPGEYPTWYSDPG